MEHQEIVVVKIKKLRPSAIIPEYKTSGAAAMDLAYDPKGFEITVNPHGRVWLPTGLAIELPHGYEAQIRSRSGPAKDFGLVVTNSPATIDSDYRGEIVILLTNTSSNLQVQIKPGSRVAQLLVLPVPQVEWDVVDVLGETARGAKGYGSTGV